MTDQEAVSTLSLDDRDKAFFENANKNHLHQDNLRWSLAAGFAAFFYGGIKLVYDPLVLPHATVARFLEISLIILGTLYFLILLVEGWYYNLYLSYLVACERRLAKGKRLFPMGELERHCVRALHPSWLLVLTLVCVANTYHLFEVLAEIGIGWAYAAAATYVAALISLAIWGRVPAWIDATLDRLQPTND